MTCFRLASGGVKTMIRKLLCWLGWHDWIIKKFTYYQKNIFKPHKQNEYKIVCKHCGKVKK